MDRFLFAGCATVSGGGQKAPSIADSTDKNIAADMVAGKNACPTDQPVLALSSAKYCAVPTSRSQLS